MPISSATNPQFFGKKTAFAVVFAALAMCAACGQEVDFLSKRSKAQDGGSAAPAGGGGADATASQATEIAEAEVLAGTTGTASGTGTMTATATSPTTGTPTTIPGASSGDLPALKSCLAAWQNGPFSGAIKNYKKISAAVSVGGTGVAINDDVATAEPMLILVDASVNVLATSEYNLLNPNGYYCIKANVNVLASLSVQLDCSAHLADSRVSVNVLSNQNDTVGAVGVDVLSDVQVVTVRPQGATCIR